jgi:hypothetical protein
MDCKLTARGAVAAIPQPLEFGGPAGAHEDLCRRLMAIPGVFDLRAIAEETGEAA